MLTGEQFICAFKEEKSQTEWSWVIYVMIQVPEMET